MSSTTTAVVRIGFTEATATNKIITNNASSNATMLVPGDTLNATATIKNKGTIPVYSIVKLTLYVTKFGENDKVLKYNKFYTFPNSTAELITDTSGNSTQEAGFVDTDSTVEISIPFKFTGAEYDNTYKKASVTYNITAYAIQTANLTKVQALNTMIQNLAIPDAYQELSFVESSGSQYIKTGIMAENSTIKYDADITYSSSSNAIQLFGSTGGYDFGLATTSNYAIDESNTTNTTYSLNKLDRIIYTADPSSNLITLSVNGNEPITKENETFNGGEIYLFATQSGDSAINYSSAKIGRFRIYKDTILVGDFVPCQRISDGELGFYNRATNTFLTNAGTNTFIAGDADLTTKNIRIYGNSIQDDSITLSASSPAEIQSVGERTKNLIPINTNYTSTLNGLTLAIENDVITLNGTLEKTNNQWGLYLDNGELKSIKGVVGYEKNTPALTTLKAGTYTQTLKYLSGTATSVGTTSSYCGLYTYKGGERILDSRQTAFPTETKTYKFTLSNNTEAQFYVIQFITQNGSLTFDNYKFQVMLEEGSTATEYEPYGYKVPVRIGGKNLLDINNMSTDVNSKVCVDISGYNVGDTLTLSTKDLYIFKISELSGSTAVYQTAKTNKFTFTITENYKNVGRIYIISTKTYSAETKENLLTQNVQLEYGSNATNYESYKEPTITNIYLDQPLRKVGDVADYIDFSTGKVVRNVRSLSLNISEMNNSENYAGWTGVQTIKNDYPEANGLLGSVTDFMCNITNENIIGINTMQTNAILFLGQNYWNLTQEEFKTNYSDLVVNIIYALDTPYEEDVNLPKLSDFDYVVHCNVLTSIQPSNVVIEI